MCKEINSEDLGYVQLATEITSQQQGSFWLGKEKVALFSPPGGISDFSISDFSIFSLTISITVIHVSQLDSWRLLCEGCGYFPHQPKFFFSMTGRLKAAIPQERPPSYSSIRGTCSCLQIIGTPHHS